MRFDGSMHEPCKSILNGPQASLQHCLAGSLENAGMHVPLLWPRLQVLCNVDEGLPPLYTPNGPITRHPRVSAWLGTARVVWRGARPHLTRSLSLGLSCKIYAQDLILHKPTTSRLTRSSKRYMLRFPGKDPQEGLFLGFLESNQKA